MTYISAITNSFKDIGEGFDGAKLKGNWYYRVTAVDKAGFEGLSSKPAIVQY